jgi:hypothetical protein
MSMTREAMKEVAALKLLKTWMPETLGGTPDLNKSVFQVLTERAGAT